MQMGKNRLEKMLVRAGAGKPHWMQMGKNGFENVLVRHALKVELLFQGDIAAALSTYQRTHLPVTSGLRREVQL